MARSLTTPVIRTAAHHPDQQYSAIHVPHAASLPVVEQSMHAPEYARALAAHWEHLSHERQLGQTPAFIQRCAYFGPWSDLDQVSYDEIVSQQPPRKPATHPSYVRGRCCCDCVRFAGSVQVEKEIPLATCSAFVPDDHDRTGARKSRCKKRGEHAQGGYDGTDDPRKPLVSKDSYRQCRQNEHRARNRCLCVTAEQEVGTKAHDSSESALWLGNNVRSSHLAE
jgi:hypothetical protein